MLKRPLSALLAVLCVLGLTACQSAAPESAETEPQTEETEPETAAETTLPAGIKSKADAVRAMYDPAAEKDALAVNPGERIGYRFHATAPFEALDVCCPSWSNNIGTLRFSLYRWDSLFEDTIAADALATELYADFADNATLHFAFDEQEAGEYLLLLHDAVETVGVWNFYSDVSGGLVYRDGLEGDGEFQASIHYTMTPEQNFMECESVLDMSIFVEAPFPVEYPADHILNTRDAMPDTWDATDGLGRVLPTHAETGDVREGKFVGLFYWTWHCSHANATAPHNVNEIIMQYPEAIHDLDHPAWGSINAPHHWNEPLFGYYNTIDKWVLRKHAELLADAGVDVIIFDNTNGTFTWRQSYIRLLEVFAEARAEGVKTPQIAFLLPFAPGENTNTQLESLYTDIYRPGKYQDLWFYWEDKPLIMAYPDGLTRTEQLHQEIREFFTFRPGQPSYTVGQTRKDHWGWLSVYPQQVYYNKDGTPEQMTVGVAQNHSAELGLTAMNGENIFGRTYTSKGYDTRENAVLYGANLAEQFEYALEVDPEFIFITGWNEWVAGRHESWQGVTNAFPDQFNDTFSRDIEPSKGQLKDHYYYQMVSYIRRFKGTRPAPEASEAVTIDIHGSLNQWQDVAPEYYAYTGNTDPRDCDGYLTTHYTNDTGRNDLALAKVAQDRDNVYFYIECANDISPDLDDRWMRLLIDTGDSAANWEGYEFILNREKAGVLERSLGGWHWEVVGEVEYAVSDRVLQVSIPRDMLGLADGFTIRFKWADNNLTENEAGEVDILDFYQYGDTAPGGRFQYRYTAKN